MNRDAHMLMAVPTSTPPPMRTVTRARISRTTMEGAEPRAMRMPISARRRLTAWAVTP
jgi:hypothetical protein